MVKILSFEEYNSKNNESDLFGVTTSPDYPTGYGEEMETKEVEDTRGIDPMKHRLKLTSTDLLEFATLKDTKTGKNYIFYFDATDPEFQNDYVIYDDARDEFLEPDAMGIEAAANDVPEIEIGFGSDDWTDGEMPLVELDEELTDDLIEEFGYFVTQGRPESRKRKEDVKKALQKILSEIKLTTESLEFEEEISEAEGIHPAVREKLIAYLKSNDGATYAEAKKYIGEKISGWNLTAEDFEEAKKLL